jgi:hypothetical protein
MAPKLLKGKSGRRGSNQRRPVWESEPRLFIENICVNGVYPVCINGVSAICKFSRLNAVKVVTDGLLFLLKKHPIKAPPNNQRMSLFGGRRFKQCRLPQKKEPGRPQVSTEIRKLVRTMAAANVTWGAPRIHGEWRKLGFQISERTVSRLMPKQRTAPSQTWKTFLTNHVGQLVSIDFFTVPTLQLRCCSYSLCWRMSVAASCISM